MADNIQSIDNSRQWRVLRRRIFLAGGMERMRLLQSLSEEIRSIATGFRETKIFPADLYEYTMTVADAQAVVAGAWLALDPANHSWPGRDRLFVPGRDKLTATFPVLAALGFFRAEDVAGLLQSVERDGAAAFIPGIEAGGADAKDAPGLVWESAVESARSKKRWRESVGAGARSWAEQWWYRSPAVWRTCAVIDALDETAEQYQNLPGRGGDAPAGLVMFVVAALENVDECAMEWRKTGWQTEVVGRNDFMGLYDVLIGAGMDKPLAVVFAAEPPRQAPPHTAGRSGARPLGELTEDELNDILGESLDL